MLTRTIVLAILPLALAFGADSKAGSKPAKDTKESKPAAKAAPAADRATPFGVFKSDGKPAEPDPKVEIPADMKVAEDGDVLRFERKLPWGVQKWTRKKNELSDVEQAAWERSKAAGARPANAVAGKE